MRQMAITRHELARRKAQLDDLQRFLDRQEQDHLALQAGLQAFIDRYRERLEAHYLELDALESRLHLATCYLCEALRRNGVPAQEPAPPRATALPELQRLPLRSAPPPEPQGGLMEMAPPSLKQLYRRAAMCWHPDRADGTLQRQQREQRMMSVNRAYEAEDRATLEALLLAAGEDPVKVTGNNGQAQLEWLRRAEAAVQGRLRVVQAHTLALQAHPMHQLWRAIERAEAKGLDPLAVMAVRLRSQIAERRRELYIGERLQPESELARAFLSQRLERMGASGAPLASV